MTYKSTPACLSSGASPVGSLSRAETTAMVRAKLEGRATEGEVKKVVDNIFLHIDKDHNGFIEFNGTYPNSSMLRGIV